MTHSEPPAAAGSASDQARKPYPLSGVRVLDFTRFVAGPYASMLLADAGADVIKVEPLGGEETRDLDPMIDAPTGPTSGYFFRFNRSKRSICVDSHTAEGREAIYRIARTSDVIVENFRPGVMEKSGLGYSDFKKIKEDIIYCSISGYGQTPSPHQTDRAFAILAEVTAGVVGWDRDETAPPIRVSMPLGDLYPGALAVAGICMALFRKQCTGQGSQVDLAMYDSLVSLNENAITMSALTGTEVLPTDRPTYTAPFGIFRASDGYLCIAVLGDKMWHRFCSAIGRLDLADDERFSSGEKRSTAMSGVLGEAIEEWLSTQTKAQAVAQLISSGVPAGSVARPTEVIESPQTAARDLIWNVPSFAGLVGRVVGSPIRVEPDGFAPVGGIPAPGENTREVLRDLGEYSECELDAMVESGALGVLAR